MLASMGQQYLLGVAMTSSHAPSLARIDASAGADIPVIDLAGFLAGEPGAQDRVTAELKHALEEVGFYFVVGHGLDPALIEGAYAAARQFYAMPLERKMALKMNDIRPGYQPFKSSKTRHSALAANTGANLVEAFFVKNDLPADHPDVVAQKPLRGQNQWPEDLPGFKQAVMAYMTAMEGLCRSVLPLYAGALGLPRDWFDAAFAEPVSTFRLSRYPAQDKVADNEFGLAPHTDSSFMTFLPENKVSGLAIQLRNGRWVDAPRIPGSLLVNSGDLLRRWTNDRFLSTPHRVVSPPGVERYAIPFFIDAGYEYPIGCIPTCVAPGEAPLYPPITYREYMTWFRKVNYAAPQA